MTPRNVRLVYLKEIRDTLRDKRTLFISVILPILLYPLLMVGLSTVMMAATKRIDEETQKVAVAGLSGEAAGKMETLLAEGEGPLAVVASEDPMKDLEAGEIDAWVQLHEGFATKIVAGVQGDATVHFDSTKDASQAAQRKIRKVLLAYAGEVLREEWGVTEEEEERRRAEIEPVKLEVDDAASKEERGAKQFGPTLALLLVIMAVSGAFYPAVDIMAGEKERGTMETLLVCPATRTEIVAGKYLTVFTMTMVTALLNFASMAITFVHFVRFLPQKGGGLALEISPGIALVIVLALIPLAGLFSAVALALSTFARSYKEGQHYLTPLFLVVMPLAMVAIIPGTDLSRFAAVPVAGVVLLVRDLMLGSASAAQVLLVMGSTGLFAGFAIWLSVRMFNKEDVLFRDPGGTKFTLFSRARGKGQVPSPGQAFALTAACMVLIYFLLPLLLEKTGPSAVFYFQFVGLFIGLPLLAIVGYRLDLERTLSLALPKRPVSWVATLIAAPAMLVIVTFLVTLIGVEEKSLEPIEKAIEKLVGDVGWPLLLLLPPLAEEIFFRGFLLSGMRSGMRAAAAVLVVAALFAAFHQLPAKYLPTGILGAWLGYLVVATGSIYPVILAHLAHNALAFKLDDTSTGFSPWAVIPALALLAASIYILERVRRSRPEEPG